jgi:hypothetical protein
MTVKFKLFVRSLIEDIYIIIQHARSKTSHSFTTHKQSRLTACDFFFFCDIKIEKLLEEAIEGRSTRSGSLALCMRPYNLV